MFNFLHFLQKAGSKNYHNHNISFKKVNTHITLVLMYISTDIAFAWDVKRQLKQAISKMLNISVLFYSI